MQEQCEGVESAHVDAVMQGRPLLQSWLMRTPGWTHKGIDLVDSAARIHGGEIERRHSVGEQQLHQLTFVPRRELVKS